MSNYFSIPEELRKLPQWVMWRYEDVGARKPTKVPYSPITGKLASTDNPNTWGTFEQAIAVAPSFSGIGFVFTENDPYTFIDLDDTRTLSDGTPNKNSASDVERQLKIFHEFNSYSEVSPSGFGLHIIIKGKILQGRRRSFVELYSTGRYATMTGIVHNDKPIEDRQQVLMQLWEQMGSGTPATNLYKGDDIEKLKDAEVIQQALNAVNGEKFKTLHEGRWQELYQSQSEADFAYIDIIAFYTQNKKQIFRLFRASPLGKRDKAKRNDYLSWMVQKSFDNMLPPIDTDGFKIAVENKQLELKIGINNANQRPGKEQNLSETTLSEQQRILSDAQSQTPSGVSEMVSRIQGHSEMSAMSGNPSGVSGLSSYRANEKEFRNFQINNSDTKQIENNQRNKEVYGSVRELSQEASLQTTIPIPPGLVGEIAQFIYAAAPRPVPEIALAGAIGLMAGITGRAYNVSGTGLNQYVLLLAQTGTGKEQIASGIDKLMNAIRFQVPTSIGFIGPSEIASGQALIKYLHAKSQCFVCILGEFGLRLQQMSNQNANSAEVSLRRMLLDLFNKSGFGQVMRPSIYSDKDKNTELIYSPSFSICGESTPERFYGALSEEMISEGLLPRFLLIEYNGERPALNKDHEKALPTMMLIDKLATLAAQAETINHANPRRVINVVASPEAKELLEDFDRYCDRQINSTSKDVVRQLWNRAHIKVLKLAGLIAVGCNLSDPIIQPDHVTWSVEMVQNDIRKLTDKFEAGEIGTNNVETRQTTEIVRILKDYVNSPWEKISKYVDAKTLHDNKIIPYSYISRRLLALAAFRADKIGATNSIKRALQILIDSDKIRELSRSELSSKYGTTQKSYIISNVNILN